MSLLMLILMAVLHMLAGFGLLGLMNIRLKAWMNISLAIIIGVAVHSFVPFVMELIKLPLTQLNIYLGLVFSALLCNYNYKASLQLLKESFKHTNFRFKIYELPFVLVIGFMLFVSAWRCFYYPSYVRDMLSGPEAIAEFVVKEKTMLNSVFNVNLESTNNPFKPPYITSLQIIYKYAGFAFGQVWLFPLVVSFVVFLYKALAEKLHKILVGLLIVLSLAIPELYAHTFMVLFDYSNAVFFFLSLFFLQQYFFDGKQLGRLVMASLLMAFATYTRSETLILAALLLPIFLWQWIVAKQKFILLLRDGLLFMLPAVLVYFLSISIFINHYLPVHYSIEGLLNKDMLNVSSLLNRIGDISKQLIIETAYYNYFFYLFILLLPIELIAYRKLGKQLFFWTYCCLAIYLGLALASHIFPLMDITHSIKRGMLKIFPVMLPFMANSQLLAGLGKRLANWEQKA